MKNSFLLWVVGIALLQSSALFAAHGEVYKWTDSDGHVHYGEKPAEENAQKLDLKTTVDSKQLQQSQESARRIQEENQLYDRAQDEQVQVEQKKEEERAKYAGECKKARNQLADFDRGGMTWYTTDAHGDRQYMSDDEAVRGSEKTRIWVGAHCDGL